MIVPKRSSILIFDTNVFLTGIDFSLIPSQIYTTPQVIEEIDVLHYKAKNRNIMNKIEVSIETGKLIIKSATENFYSRVKQKSIETGDYNALSKTDFGVIALALELKENENADIIIYTNDYSIENLCSHLKLDFQPIFKPGIKKKFLFETFCPTCNKIYDAHYSNRNCDDCGSKLKRRVIGTK